MNAHQASYVLLVNVKLTCRMLHKMPWIRWNKTWADLMRSQEYNRGQGGVTWLDAKLFFPPDVHYFPVRAWIELATNYDLFYLLKNKALTLETAMNLVLNIWRFRSLVSKCSCCITGQRHMLRKVLSTLFCIHQLTGAHDYLVWLWLTYESSVSHVLNPNPALHPTLLKCSVSRLSGRDSW